MSYVEKYHLPHNLNSNLELAYLPTKKKVPYIYYKKTQSTKMAP